MFRILAIIAPSTVASMSASSKTMKGAFPPSSMAGRTTLSAASFNRVRPTSVDFDFMRRLEARVAEGSSRAKAPRRQGRL